MLDRATQQQLDRIEGMLAELLGQNQPIPFDLPPYDHIERLKALAREAKNNERRAARERMRGQGEGS